MNAHDAQKTAVGSFRLLLLVLRSIAAPLVMLLVSYPVYFLGVVFMAFLARWVEVARLGFWILPLLVGFCGIFSGTLCIPRIGRRWGSVVLLLLGLSYYYFFGVSWGDRRGDDGQMINVDNRKFMFLSLLACGGSVAAFLSGWSRALISK